jgi:hypothetical protein
MTENLPDSVDWTRIADRFQQVMSTMLHDEGRYHDSTFYADALARTFGYVAASEPGTSGRALPYEHLENGQGLTTDSYNRFDVNGATALSRMHAEQAEEQVREMRAEVARVYRDARKDVAGYLRERCNERTVPSRYRREGVAWAADLIDPSVPKDQYGNVVRDEEAS